MTQYDVIKDFKFEVKSVINKTYKKQNDLYVDKVVLKTDNHQVPKGKITINPTVKETKVEKVKRDGTVYENEIEDKRDPTILELDSQFPKIKELTTAVNDKQYISLKGMVRTVRDKPEDKWNFFIKADELDNFKAFVMKVPEDSDNTEKIEESSTAEDFVEDQTNIDVEDEDLDEENEESDVLFGEDEHE